MITRTLAIAALLASSPAYADDDTPDARVVDTHLARGGAAAGYTTRLPLDVPAFHDLAPKLAIAYDSAHGDGAAGVGVRLDGVSYIERVSADRGTPRFDATDVYLLDGAATGELDPCPASGTPSPSCKTGGTGTRYMPRYETFDRVRFDPTTNSWRITKKDGVEYRYGLSAGSRLLGPAGTLRWYLEQVADPRGNLVTWTYAPDSTLQCADLHPVRAAYGGFTIDFYVEARPDPVVVAAGGCAIRSDKRLKTIDVKAGTARARAYTLAYAASGATQRSTLTTVTEFGTASTVSAAGVVSGGIYQAVAHLSFTAENAPGFTATLSAESAAGPYDGVKVLFDFSGDGIADLCEMRNCSPADPACTADPTQPTGLYSACAIGKGDGTFGAIVSTTHATTAVAGTRPFTPDVNGDGRADFCWVGAGNFGLVSHCALSLGNGGWKQLVTDQISTKDLTGYVTRVGDITGDGIPDICAVAKFDVECAIGKGDGTFGALVASPSQAELGRAGAAVVLRDVDGDGNADLCNADPTLFEVTCLRATGTGAFAQSVTTRLSTGAAYAPVFGDLNGDGVVDVCGRKAVAGTIVGCALGLGDGSFGPLVDKTLSTTNYPYTPWLADVTGDGRDDFCLAAAGTSAMTLACAASFGDGTLDALTVKSWTKALANHTVEVTDIDGDGSADVCALASSSTGGAVCARATSIRPNLIASHGGLYGGTTKITFAASTSVANTYMPLGFVVPIVTAVSTDDGRGNVATFPTTYTGGLFHRGERRFLGFATASTTIDATGTRRVDSFRQTLAGAGNLASEQIQDATGKAWAKKSLVWSETAAAPFRALVVERDDFECELGTTCRQRKVQMSYDEYGNTLLLQDSGDVAVTGDERTTQVVFYPNLAAYIVGLPAVRNEYPGLGTTLPPLRRTVSVFDGATSATTPPAVGNVTQTQLWNSKDGSYITTTRRFDSFGNTLAVIDALNHVATTTFDTTFHVYPITSCDALMHCTTRVFDPALGLVTSETDPNAQVTKHVYDSLGRETQTALPNGGQINTLYLSIGTPTAQYIEVRRPDGYGNDGGLWTLTYLDGLGRVYRHKRETYFTQDIAYAPDAPDRVATRSGWYNAYNEKPKLDTFVYDGLSRVTKTTHADGSTRSTVYGIGTRLDTDELGHQKTTFIDARGLVAKIRELGSVTHDTAYAFDAVGRVTTVTDAMNHATTVAHNSLDLVIKQCDPDSGCKIYNYDGLGRMVTRTDATNATVKLAYDAVDRLTSKVQPGGATWTWAYDEASHGFAVGRLTTHTYPAGSDSYTYDKIGHITSEAMCRRTMCNTMSFIYDTTGEGRLDKVTYPDGEIVDYTYDTTGALSAASGYASAMVHDARGELTTATLANGVVETAAFDPVTYRPTQRLVKKSTTVLFQDDLKFDVSGNLASEKSINGGTHDLAFTYDARDRLISMADAGAVVQTFGYDAIGNIASNSRLGSYAYGDATHVHAVTKAGGTTYSYDANGNMKAGGGRTLAWDGENRLASATVDGVTETYDYDGSGARVDKIAGAVTTRYFGHYLEHDGTSLIKYVWIGDRRLARRIATGEKSFFHGDHVRSTRVITNGTGAVVARYDYWPFGDVATSTGAFPDDIQFAGQRLDGTGLVYMNARYYDPVLGRFASADSLVPRPLDPQSLNRYAYASNNPMSRIDPTGHHDDAGGGGTGDPDSGGADDGGGGGGGGHVEGTASETAAEHIHDMNSGSPGGGQPHSGGGSGRGLAGGVEGTASETAAEHIADMDAGRAPGSIGNNNAGAQSAAAGAAPKLTAPTGGVVECGLCVSHRELANQIASEYGSMPSHPLSIEGAQTLSDAIENTLCHSPLTEDQQRAMADFKANWGHDLKSNLSDPFGSTSAPSTNGPSTRPDHPGGFDKGI